MRCCDSLPPISPRFVSFAWRYHRCVRCSSPPVPDAEPWINLELIGGISSRLARWKRQGLPSSRRYPCDHSPHSSDPGVTRQAEWTMSELPDAAPATDNDEGSPRVLISGLNRTAFDLAVYASQGWSPTRHARLASGCWSGSTGRDWLPAGFHLKGFKLRLSSSPELLGAMPGHVFQLPPLSSEVDNGGNVAKFVMWSPADRCRGSSPFSIWNATEPSPHRLEALGRGRGTWRCDDEHGRGSRSTSPSQIVGQPSESMAQPEAIS